MQPDSSNGQPRSPYGNGPKSQKRARLTAGIDKLGISCSPKQVDLLISYLDMLELWNKTYNLTAIRDPMLMIDLHLLDSLAVQPHITHKQNLIDIGTGPGLPGIPLAIMNPSKKFTLLDSAGKKTRFLFQVRNELDLNNVLEINTRAEAFKPEITYDAVLSRAFSSLPDMLKTCGHLVGEKGCFMAMKGKLPESELSAIPKNYKVSDLCRLKIPNVEGERHLITITHS
ncbi:16S rRNA (guanine(527)-N(7))-methyltransferase RsmG [SAR92 clade bacterium H921]|nr:16S rRNA (guanine(527)-N(7))-methyltransferase RsmG [SAR92 clade bacterium H921]